MAKRMVFIDDPLNADWTKQTWENFGIESADEMRKVLADANMTVEQFKELDAYVDHVGNPDLSWLKEM